jgi:hypothetical protein
MEDKLTRLNELEQIFSTNKYNGTVNEDYIYVKGKIPILVSAPHAVKQTKENHIKLPDTITGGLALLMNELTNCHVIAKAHDDGVDPNNSDMGMDNGYKEKIIDVIRNEDIKLLIDLHGLRGDRETDVDIITHYGMTIGQDITIIDELKRCLKENDILNISKDKYYFAESERVIVHKIWNVSKIPSIELELNWHYRNPSEPINLIKIVNSIEQFIAEYKI